MKKKKVTLIISSILLLLIVVFLIGNSFGFFKYLKKGEILNIITIGGIDVDIVNEETASLKLEKAYPISDEEGLSLSPFEFKITNNTKEKLSYSIAVETDTDELSSCKLNDGSSCQGLSTQYIKYAYKKNDGTYSTPLILSDSNNIIVDDNIASKEEITYSLIVWIDENAGNEIINQYFFGKLIITAAKYQDSNYKEVLLNGTDPVITDNLVPVIISATGKVTKADVSKEWYSYANKNWANAVILKDESITYDNNQEIPEGNIESYFVWIPRYKYRIFNEGNYTSLTSISNSVQTINVVFESKDVEPSTGSTVGSYLTHPAFTSFDVNGIWVGKFETGYDGATSTTDAQVNSVDTSKIIIKPNVYSWRSITIGNAFKNSYDYNRNLDSHMMKNTEWGAVAYLQHSKYGSQTSVRINNNRNYITGYSAVEEPTLGHNNKVSIEGNRNEGTILGADGTYTVNYLNTSSTVSSTTGNYSGIYDMSGGAWEYVMGYTISGSENDTSSITSLYPDFYNDSNYTKYWDKYTTKSIVGYNNRILGDATGEMGPFGNEVDPDTYTRYKTSWYVGFASFANSSQPWFGRGGAWYHGSSAGCSAFGDVTGNASTLNSFRLVLAPTA